MSMVLTLSCRGQAYRGVGQEWPMRIAHSCEWMIGATFRGPCLGNYGVPGQLVLHSEPQSRTL